MSKIKTLGSLFSNPLAVIRDGVAAQYEKNHLKEMESKYGISQFPTIDLLDLFPDLSEQLNNYSYLDGTSQVTDMVLLKQLARGFEKCQYLEIGSWRGESISNIADIADQCFSITLSAEQMRANGDSESSIEIHGVFSKEINNLKTIHANSLELDFSTLGQKFDLMFVDGDHSFEGVKSDTENVYNLRANEKSVIVWHDYGFRFEQTRPSVIHGILAGIPKEKHKNLYHVSNTLCAVYIEDADFKNYLTKFPTKPNKKFSINIKTEKI